MMSSSTACNKRKYNFGASKRREKSKELVNAVSRTGKIKNFVVGTSSEADVPIIAIDTN